jgi:DNA-binding protein
VVLISLMLCFLSSALLTLFSFGSKGDTIVFDRFLNSRREKYYYLLQISSLISADGAIVFVKLKNKDPYILIVFVTMSVYEKSLIKAERKIKRAIDEYDLIEDKDGKMIELCNELEKGITSMKIMRKEIHDVSEEKKRNLIELSQTLKDGFKSKRHRRKILKDIKYATKR